MGLGLMTIIVKHGAGEDRLADPRYLRALLRGMAPVIAEPARVSAFGVDAVFASSGGLCLVIGWIDDRDAALREIVVECAGRTAAGRRTLALPACRCGGRHRVAGRPASWFLTVVSAAAWNAGAGRRVR